MGLLDDAIREHLDLKRRRGADPADIERAEREALGPVRRNREPTIAEDDDPTTAEGQPAGSAFDDPDEAVATDLAEVGLEGDRVAEPAPDLRPRDDGPFVPETLDDIEPDELDPAPETRVMRAADIPTPDHATAEFDVEEAFAADSEQPGAPDQTSAAEDDEDVLEETPEFLQDTPDHDRLWFEQRPPRDFDFDN